jgi:hypothetical protein
MLKFCATVALCVLAASAQESGDTTTSTTKTLKPCVCKEQWNHMEAKCNGTHSGEIKFITYNGCPSLKALETCEVNPVQSWCDTTEDECIGQTDESRGDGWMYCDPEDGGKPQLPFCTCKSKWTHSEGVCANMKGGMFMYGCPSTEVMAACEPDYTEEDVPWCETNEDECLQQENWDQPDLGDEDTKMIGQGWAYCDPSTQQTQLPQCTCIDDDDGWQPSATSCTVAGKGNKQLPTFYGCPTLTELESACGPDFADEDQPYCHTYQERCDDQSDVNDDEGDMKNQGWTDMIGEGWAYCNPETQYAEAPFCECKDSWWHAEQKCFDDMMEYETCPTQGELRKCEWDVSESWCETTYKYCNTQSSDAWDQGWSYCNAESKAPIQAPCECKERWAMTEGSTGACTLDSPSQFRGCPTLDQIQGCEGAGVDYTWCETTEEYCREQEGAQIGYGWVKCDPQSQLAVGRGSSGSGVAAAIGLTFVFTVMFCVALFIGFLMAYRRYINRHKRGYSQELLENN